MADLQPKIFLLEIVVDDINTWHLPENILECDESCVEFLFLDEIKLFMCEQDFGFTSGKAGKSCLFVLDKAPNGKCKVNCLTACTKGICL